MRVVADHEPLFRALDDAHRAAAADTLDDIRRNQARRTGTLADSFAAHEVSRGAGPRGLVRIYISSTAVYADAVEHGANAREKASVRKGTKRSRSKRLGDMHGPLRARASRKGPHMAGNHVVLEHGQGFLAHMSYRLAERMR